jgi:protein O-mannosyl-transferase
MTERLRVALLLVLAMLLYGNTLVNGFTMDDELYIFRNPAVTSPSVHGLFEATKANNVLRPFTFATFALNWVVGGGHPSGYHLFNLLLQAAVTLLLYLVLRKLLEAVPQAATIAFVTALLFAVHPIHTEAVASIAGRSELLAVGFLLGAWLLHLHDRPILALVCFVLALLSKESAVVLLPLVLAGDYARGKLKPLHRYVLIAGIALVYLALLWKVQGGRFGEKGIDFLDNPLAHLPASLRILNALRIAWKYVGLQVYPATLSCDYSYNAILLFGNLRHTVLPTLTAALVLALWSLAIWRRKNEWFLAGAIYLGGFAVTANILVPTGTIMAERLAYLPSAGFCLLVALIWIRLEERNRRAAWAVLAIVVLALSVRTVIRNRDWRDNFSLFSAAVKAVPRSAKMHANLGGQYMNRGQLDAAQMELQTALGIYPDSPEALEISGLVESRLGHDQEARRLLEKALSMTPKDNVNYEDVAVTFAAQLMKLGGNDEALDILNEVIATSPGYSRAWSNRAVLRYQRGGTAAALADAQTALQLDPSNRQAQNLRAVLNRSARVASQP